MKALIWTMACLFSLTRLAAQTADSSLQITHLTGDFYIYTTYNLYKGEQIPANGMYLVTTNGVVLFDTPWDTAQFQPLLDSIRARHHQQVQLCIATHFHDDRTAGLAYYRQQGIKTYTTRRTDSLSQQKNHKRAQFLLAKDTTFHIGQYTFDTYYPGPGHTADNIVLWFPKEKILYGACLIKSVEDEDLGYLGDANKTAYAATMRNVQQKCRHPRYVIVGHGDWSSTRSVAHTRAMAETLRKQNLR
jgi:metallo-beta-lactamase class B